MHKFFLYTPTFAHMNVHACVYVYVCMYVDNNRDSIFVCMLLGMEMLLLC